MCAYVCVHVYARGYVCVRMCLCMHAYVCYNFEIRDDVITTTGGHSYLIKGLIGSEHLSC